VGAITSNEGSGIRSTKGNIIITENAFIGNIDTFQESIYSTGSIQIDGNIEKISSKDSDGIFAQNGPITLNSPITVSGNTRAFNKSPEIGLLSYTAEWSENADGSASENGDTYTYDPSHKYVKIEPYTQVAPTISGPSSMSLTVGYGPTKSDAFTIDGTPEPTVSLDNTYGGIIAWNDAESKLAIGSGLAAGSYSVKLTAENSAGSVTHEFILTINSVTPSTPTPTTPTPSTPTPSTPTPTPSTPTPPPSTPTPAPVKNGIIFEVDGYYYYENGQKKTGFITTNGDMRYFDPEENGKLAVGWKVIKHKQRYLGEDGVIPRGWTMVEGKESFIFKYGIIRDGFVIADGFWRLFEDRGVPHPTGFDFVDGHWRYFGERSKMLPPGFYVIYGHWRYIMDGSIVAPIGWYTLDGKPRYVADGGVLLKPGFYPIEGHWRYIMDGSIVAPPGWYTLDGKPRYVSEDGILLPQGFHVIEGRWRYILDGSIVAPPGWYTVDGKRRYVAEDAILLPQGWHEIDGAMHYILDGSIPISGKHIIDGFAYVFDEYGKPIIFME
jgi:glucan-binding YG repeat protein